MATVIKIPRFLCPALGRAIRTKSKAELTKRDLSPALKKIQKLEAYIKDVSKVVAKEAKKVSMENQADDISDEDIEKMYAGLASPERPALPPPRSTISSALLAYTSSNVSKNTHLDSIDWEAEMEFWSSSGAYKTMTAFEYNEALASMPHHVRIRIGRELLDMVEQVPNMMTFDLLMDSFASQSKAYETMEMFDLARRAGLEPTMYSYAHLMKAFAVTADLPRASALYTQMQKIGIEPNLVVQTSLIATCIRSGNVDEAFAIFDTLKYKSLKGGPDVQTYSLMIHACSLDPKRSAERAADLFTEMTERGLQPTVETFNALLHVYSQRKEYFVEAWQVSESMQRNNIPMDKTTWHCLLSACVTNRDIDRTRTLVKELMRLGQQNSAWVPDAVTYQTLFRAYAHAKVKRSFTPLNLIQENEALQGVSETNLWVDEDPFTSAALLRESAQIMHFVCTKHPQLVTSQLIDTYMTIAQSFEAPDRFKNDWSTIYSDKHVKNKYSYQMGLSAAYTFKDYALLKQVWSERCDWRASLPDKFAHQADDFEAIKTYIASLARCDHLPEATEVLDEARGRFTFVKSDLKTFQTKMMQLGNEDAYLLYREIVPETSRSQKNRGRFYGHFT